MILILLVIENPCPWTYITSPPSPPAPGNHCSSLCFDEIGFKKNHLFVDPKPRLISHTVEIIEDSQDVVPSTQPPPSE